MALIIGKIKCCFCGEKEGVLESVHGYGLYDAPAKRTHFHPECLELVEMYPEIYGHKAADLAIDINDKRNKNMLRKNNNIISDYQKTREKLKMNNFERMMPTKT